MAEEIVSGGFDWTLSTETNREESEMTIAMQCLNSSFATYLSRFGFVATMALLVSTSI